MNRRYYRLQKDPVGQLTAYNNRKFFQDAICNAPNILGQSRNIGSFHWFHLCGQDLVDSI